MQDEAAASGAVGRGGAAAGRGGVAAGRGGAAAGRGGAAAGRGRAAAGRGHAAAGRGHAAAGVGTQPWRRVVSDVHHSPPYAFTVRNPGPRHLPLRNSAPVDYFFFFFQWLP